MGSGPRKPGGGRVLPDLRPSVILLAAGSSSRFHGTKQLARIGGSTLLERALASVPASRVKETIVVVGHEAPIVSKAVGTRQAVTVALNPDYLEGMATSIRTGISALSPGAEAAMVLLVDQPFVTRRFVRRILDAFEARGSEGIVAAAREGVVAPPAVFSRRYFAELSRLRGDQGAKSVIERHRGSVSLVRARSARRLADVDTRRDLEEARRLLEP